MNIAFTFVLDGVLVDANLTNQTSYARTMTYNRILISTTRTRVPRIIQSTRRGTAKKQAVVPFIAWVLASLVLVHNIENLLIAPRCLLAHLVPAPHQDI